MKIKKVFKFKIVYRLTIFISLTFSILFSFASVNRVITNSFLNVRDIMYTLFIFITAMLSLLTLVLLIVKNQISILTFSITISVITIALSYGVFESIFVLQTFGNGSNTDYILTPIVYFILFSLIVIVLKSRYRLNYFYELEEIGKSDK